MFQITHDDCVVGEIKEASFFRERFCGFFPFGDFDLKELIQIRCLFDEFMLAQGTEEKSLVHLYCRCMGRGNFGHLDHDAHALFSR